MAVPVEDWPLVGRDDDLGRVVEAVRERGAVVIAGEAGVGKSRLAREVLARAGSTRTRMVMASRAARELPLGAFAPWLPAHGDRRVDVTSVRAAADALADGGPDDVLGIDDAHLLDGVSATVVHHLAERRAVRLVLTLRTGERAPDAVVALWKDGLARRRELRPLTDDATAALARAALGGVVDDDAARRLVATTHGNALWLRHLIEGERAAGRLAAEAGRWHWTGSPTLSPVLAELVAERIGALSPLQREALELLALGEPLGVGAMRHLADPAVVERLADRGLLQVADDGGRQEIWLGHPLYGEVVRAGLNPLRARRLKGVLSDALATTGDRRVGDRLRRAVLDLDSDRTGDPQILAEAAARSVALGDVDLAERLFRAARDAGGGFEPQLGLGSMLMWRLSRPDEAEQELIRAAGAATTAAEAARALRARVHNAYLGCANIDEATRLLDAALAPGAGTPHMDLVATRAFLDVLGRQGAVAEAPAREVLSSSDASWAARALAGWSLVTVRAHRGHGEEIETLAAEAVTAARNSPECAPLRAAIGFWEVVGVCCSGRLDAADDRVRAMREERGEYSATFARLAELRVELDRGHARRARGLIDRIRPSFPGRSSGWTAQLSLMAAAAAGMTGDAATATVEIERTLGAVHPGVRLNEAEILWAQAWVSAARHDLDDALALVRRSADRAADVEEHASEMLARHTAVCFGDRGQSAALDRLRAVVEGRRVEVAAAHARAWTRRDPAALLRISDDLAELDLLLIAADAAAQASVLFRATADEAAAARAAARASHLADRCGGAATPALRLATVAVTLSAREREIAIVAAEGLTNRQVAARLGVSVRTVESHIYHARTRLGLAGRADLIALVAPGGS